MKAEIEGKVVLRTHINKKGKVDKCLVVESASGILNEPAIDAVKVHKFEPVYNYKENVPIWVIIPINFKLDK